MVAYSCFDIQELRFEPIVICTPIEKKNTFRASKLIDGDIVCFQKSHTVESAEQYRYPNVPSFLDYVHNQQVVVHFRSLEKPKEDDFCLEMSKLFTYDVVVERVAQILNLDDPSKIRLTSHNSYSQQPKPQPIKYRGVDHLADMLIQHDQTSDILYYEVLDIPLPELESLKFLKVAFHHDMKGEVELSHPDAELRLLEVFYRKIYKNVERIEKETPAGKKGAEEATSEVIMSLTRLGENFNRQVEQIGLQNILENLAAALELSKSLRSTGMKDLKNDLSDELMASVPSEVSVVRDKVVLYAFLKMLESRMSNLSAEVTLSSSKLTEAEAKLKSYESSEVDHNSRVESLEAEVIKKQAENETLKNQAIVSEQKASTSQQKAVFREAELIRKQAENEALKNQAENEALKNQAIVSEQKTSSSQQKALFLEAELIKKQAENEALKNQAIASEQKASSSEQKALFLEAELIRNEAENEVLKNQAIALEQKASRSEQKALILARTILKRDKYSKDSSDAASKLIEDSSGSGESKDQGADPLPFPSSR
ncbi:uncharacterized protein LOC116116022 [Pistacia vera]|uniref:uncharacterized protein LOC116116022 n=1 Tax=Pistacia vera TaxID=55513 RepID=UPI001262BB8D|nr:uncharacterized protein LOC116116022 [Pistacia vera]